MRFKQYTNGFFAETGQATPHNCDVILYAVFGDLGYCRRLFGVILSGLLDRRAGVDIFERKRLVCIRPNKRRGYI